MLDRSNLMTYAMFSPLVNQSLTVRLAPENEVPLLLIKATERKLAENDGRNDAEETEVRNDPFTLLFTGPEDRFLQQFTYVFFHEALGSFPMGIVPVGKDKRGYIYEAVFS